ncbi:MAG TPA: metallopeptidase TldD-related protein [Patescibacteria group bacterium]|nr:metallopeptidase TldD-related protein [Patescibacteria group bacterium]
MIRRGLAVFLFACFAALPMSVRADQPVADPAAIAAPAALKSFSLSVPVQPLAHPAPRVLRAGQTQSATAEDDTLRAMKDEMARSLKRLQTADLGKPYFIAYRLIDVQVRAVTADFGSIVDSSTSRSRFMLVQVRMGNYHIDSSNFITGGGFQGSIGNAGQVGIDGDYYSLRQDLWLATDQAYKQAADQLARKQAFLNSLAKPPEIDDFARIQQPVVLIEPHAEPDWTSRNWNKEAEETSSVFRDFPDIYAGRVTYYMVYQTYYLLTSEGTELRIPSSTASVEAAVQTQAPDGMPLHDFYSHYAATPAGLPSVAQVKQHLQKISQELVALRAAPTVSDYEGPVLFEPRAAGSLLAQTLAASVSGARPPLSTVAMYNQMFTELGGIGDWTGRIGQRVLPADVTLTDDPTARDFQGQPLIGGYQVDAEGVRGERVTLVRNGLLENLLMSRRPGPDFNQSNGHGRAAGLGTPTPAISNLFLQTTDGLDAQALQQKFIDVCKSDGLPWCLIVKRMDNPALAAIHRGDFDAILSGLISGVSNGDRLPLIVERVWVNDGHEELVRGARIIGLSVRDLRNLSGVGNDPAVFNFMQNPQFSATALAAFGSAQGGLPSAIVTPSLLVGDVQVNGPHGGEQRLPLVPPPPLQ